MLIGAWILNTAVLEIATSPPLWTAPRNDMVVGQFQRLSKSSVFCNLAAGDSQRPTLKINTSR